MTDLASAVAIAFAAHDGQFDKAGERYILHPLRVMMEMPDVEHQIVAVLHDVVEDRYYSIADLRAEGFAEYIVDAVDALTRREKEGYDAYVQRVARNRIATRVKIADLCDNLDPGRVARADLPLSMVRRYADARHQLMIARSQHRP